MIYFSRMADLMAATRDGVGIGAAWGTQSGRPVPAAGRTKLDAFVKGLRIGPHLDELWDLLRARG